MINNYVSVKQVIAKVFADSDINDNTNKVYDFIEWAGEAVEKIGAQPTLVTKVTGKGDEPLIILNGYHAKLPNDLFRLNQILYGKTQEGPWIALHQSAGNFDVFGTNPIYRNLASAVQNNKMAPESALIMLAQTLYNLTYEEAALKINTDSGVREQLSFLLDSKTNLTGEKTGSYSEDFVYILKPGYINTKIEKGYLMISYQAIPRDEDGYPLIPNDPGFLEAVYWYIMMKLYYPMWVRKEISSDVYYDAKKNWAYYCKQAYGNAMMPTLDGMESIKNIWLKLVPDITAHDSAYSGIGDRQHVYNKNSYFVNSYVRV